MAHVPLKMLAKAYISQLKDKSIMRSDALASDLNLWLMNMGMELNIIEKSVLGRIIRTSKKSGRMDAGVTEDANDDDDSFANNTNSMRNRLNDF